MNMLTEKTKKMMRKLDDRAEQKKKCEPFCSVYNLTLHLHSAREKMPKTHDISTSVPETFQCGFFFLFSDVNTIWRAVLGSKTQILSYLPLFTSRTLLTQPFFDQETAIEMSTELEKKAFCQLYLLCLILFTS